MDFFRSTVAKCRVRWIEFPGHGIPLLFIHGLGCSSIHDYARVIWDSRFEGRRAFLIDLPGYGFSDKPENFSYSIKQQALVIAELVAHLKLEQFCLYGHSMGGSICIEATPLFSDTLAGLVVSEPNFHPGGGYFSRKIVGFAEDEYIKRVHRRLVEKEESPWSGCLSVAAPWAVWKSAASLVQGKDWFSMFVDLAIPKLFIIGEESLPDEDFDQFNKLAIPTCVLSHCGHSMAWENPGDLAATLSHFCASLTS